MKRLGMYVAGVLMGALSGWLYWKYVGCLTGTCPMKSSQPFMTLYGAAMGFLLTGLLLDVHEWWQQRRRPQ